MADLQVDRGSHRSRRLKAAFADQLLMLAAIIFIIFFASGFGRVIAGFAFFFLLLVPSLMIARELRPSRILWFIIAGSFTAPLAAHLYIMIDSSISFGGRISTIIVSFSNVAIFSAGITLITIRLLRSSRVSLREIVGGLNIYFLLGLLWSSIYTIIFCLNEEAFRYPASGMRYGADLSEFNSSGFFYYSFVTLTTLGFGEITPVSDIARKFTVVEAVVGQFYLATIVAFVISRVRMGSKD